MVQVSEAASVFMKEHLTSIPAPADVGYRLDASSGGYKLRLDHPSDDDRVVLSGEQVLFMVAQDLDDELDGIVLDVSEGEEERLVLEPADGSA